MQIFPKEFIDLQIEFARRVSEILKINFIETLFNYSSLPIRIGIPFNELEQGNQDWQEFCKIIEKNPPAKSSYDYYLSHTKDNLNFREQFGCFSYDYLSNEKLVKLHFANNQPLDTDILGDAQMAIRVRELKTLFQAVIMNHPEAEAVVSSSWLYNVSKFTRLFPEEFFQNTEIKWDFRSLGLWGQFIDKNNQIKQAEVATFLEKMTQATSLEAVENAFELKNIKCFASISYFYQKYAI